MPLYARMVDPPTLIDPATGEVDGEFSACLEMEDHGLLFAHPQMNGEQFPLLSRMSDYHADADYVADELEGLILEVELAARLVGTGSPVLRFTGPFHSLCCVARSHEKDVALRADQWM